MNPTKFRFDQRLRIAGFVFSYSIVYMAIAVAIVFQYRSGVVSDRDSNLALIAGLLAFAYLFCRLVKRHRYRCPTCREEGILHGWCYVREYERVPPRGRYTPDTFQCNFDLKCCECGGRYQKKGSVIKKFKDYPLAVVTS